MALLVKFSHDFCRVSPKITPLQKYIFSMMPEAYFLIPVGIRPWGSPAWRSPPGDRNVG